MSRPATFDDSALRSTSTIVSVSIGFDRMASPATSSGHRPATASWLYRLSIGAGRYGQTALGQQAQLVFPMPLVLRMYTVSVVLSE